MTLVLEMLDSLQKELLIRQSGSSMARMIKLYRQRLQEISLRPSENQEVRSIARNSPALDMSFAEVIVAYIFKGKRL